MAAKTGTYSLIRSETIDSDKAGISFISIPQTYTDLIIVITGYGSSDGSVPWLQFNNDVSTNYSQTFLSGNGTAARSDRNSNFTTLWASYSPGFSTSSSNISNAIIHIFDYANTTTFKSTVMRFNSSAGNYPGTSAAVGLWRKAPEAITSISFGVSAGSFKLGTTFDLYGIEAGNL